MQQSHVVFAAAIVGDITPRDGISKPEKCRMETEAINSMQEMLGGTAGEDCMLLVGSVWPARAMLLQRAFVHPPGHCQA